MIKINSNIMVVSIFCFTALIIFFYYQYNTPYNQCLRDFKKQREPKYFVDDKKAYLDILETGKENNFYKNNPFKASKPIPMNKPFNLLDGFGIERVNITREEQLNDIAEQAHRVCARRLKS